MNGETFLACLDAADTLNQFVSRMGLLSALSATSAFRSSVEGSFLPFCAGGRALTGHGDRPLPALSIEDLVNLMQEANEKALFDWRNRVQSAILMQDEAAIWAQSMRERLEAIGHAATLDPPRQTSRAN